jgi:hypothetical protein
MEVSGQNDVRTALFPGNKARAALTRAWLGSISGQKFWRRGESIWTCQDANPGPSGPQRNCYSDSAILVSIGENNMPKIFAILGYFINWSSYQRGI